MSIEIRLKIKTPLPPGQKIPVLDPATAGSALERAAVKKDYSALSARRFSI